MNQSIACASLCLLAASASLAQPVSHSEATGARDMFFGGFENAKAAAKPAAVKTPARSATKPPAPTAVTAGNTASARPRANSIPLMNASLGPLGLRYAILKVNGIETVEVAPSTRFKSGDRIQLKVQTNSDGYLYIVTQGSSGAWQVIFPSRSANQGSNRVQAGDEKLTAFRFDAKPGVEKLFVVLTRVPEADLDRAIYKLAVESGSGDEPKSAPAKPKHEAQGPLLMAGNLTVSDPLVSRLRTSYTRDLVLEEVEAPAASATQERAVYVATKARSTQARVVADIKLVHE